MSQIRFRVLPPRTAKPVGLEPILILQQDRWNDYRFRTQYQLYYFENGKQTDETDAYIGAVKILRRGQTAADDIQISEDFSELTAEFCSVGESLDYYTRLNSLHPDMRDWILMALRDVVINPNFGSQFESEEGWRISLFRDQRYGGYEFRLLAGSILTGDYTSVPAENLRFSFKLPNWQQAVEFTFSSPTIEESFLGYESGLPGRIAVIVGRNGSGKSTVLARLARVAYGTVGERIAGDLAELGTIEPVGIGFSRIVNISFSPFDSFRLPASDAKSRRKVAKETQQGDGRFIFIGLRDIARERRAARSSGERMGTTVLKSISELAADFRSFLGVIEARGRKALLNQVAKTLLLEQYLSELTSDPTEAETDHTILQGFLESSTGHKITLLITAGLIAHIEPRSLVLIDEPETHLHPPLLAALMHSLRQILEAHKAFAVVATHSPVIVQESLAQHVKVIRREGEVGGMLPVKIETFGESIGLITQEIFGLSAETTDFHQALDGLIENLPNLDKIEALFQNNSMSHQARAYVMSRLASRGKE